MATDEEQQYMADMQRQIQMQQSQQQSQQQYYSQNNFQTQKQNLVEWELDFSQELRDIERLLRCDVLKIDKDGNEQWVENPDPNSRLFNSLGVMDITRQIKMYLNKNKVLSNYTADEINVRLRMLGHELRSWIYNNYEAYGMDNEYKMNNYAIVVLTILSMIEDAYRRALGGETHRGLGESRFVNQSDPVAPQQNFNIYPTMKKKKWYAPWTWNN
jgi:hypothetical protein